MIFTHQDVTYFPADWIVHCCQLQTFVTHQLRQPNIDHSRVTRGGGGRTAQGDTLVGCVAQW